MTKIIELNKKNIDLSEITESNNTNNDDVTDKPVEPDLFDQMLQMPNVPNHIIDNTPPILTPEESRERRKVLLHVQRYIQNFPDVCKEWRTIDLKSKSKEELESILEEIKMTVGNSNANMMGGVIYSQCLSAIESFGPLLNMDLEGLSNIALRDKAINNCVKELTLEYMNLNYVKPHIRLGLLTGGLIMQLNNVNKKNKIIVNFLDKEINEDIKEEFNDL